jgi:hypothetical protein
MKVTHGLFVVLFALASMTFVQPVKAQKGPPPKPTTAAPLQMYDANGQVVGHYIGWSCVSLLDGTQRVDACTPLAVDPNQPWISISYETVDCSGPGYLHAAFPTAIHRDGWLLLNGRLLYPDGPAKNINGLSQQTLAANGSVLNCTSVTFSSTSSTVKSVTIGPGPYTVK